MLSSQQVAVFAETRSEADLSQLVTVTPYDQQAAVVPTVLWLPTGLNSPTESEFRFLNFIFLRCPSGNLRNLIA